MNKYIDIGINLTNKQFQNQEEEIVNKAIENGVKQMILTGTSVKNSKQAYEITLDYHSELFSTAGIHPHDAKNFNNSSIEELKALLSHKKVVAVGECGLDFDRDFSPRPIQEQCFQAQLALAIEVQKPLFLHERAAFDRFLAITNEHINKLPKAVVHCFTGTLQEAKTYLDKGFYLGFTGAISDVNRFSHLKEVIQYVPLNRIMIETDAPFMLPKNVPKNELTRFNERRNEPAFLAYVADTIAKFKNIPLSEVANQTTKNAVSFFNLGGGD